MIIRALPAAGKTWCLKHRDDCVDTDGLIIALMGEVNADAVALLHSHKKKRLQFEALIGTASRNCHLLTNLDLTFFGYAPDLTVGYAPDDYLDHIRKAGRLDLLSSFKESELYNWAKDLRPDALLLNPGEFLCHAIEKMGL